MVTLQTTDEKTDNWDSFWKKRNRNLPGRIITWFRKRYVTTALADYMLSNTEKGILIEAGCGSGEVTLLVAEQRKDKVILADCSHEALEIARWNAGRYCVDAELIECDITQLSEHIMQNPDNIVYNIGVVEHFDDCSDVLLEMAKTAGKYAIAIIPEKSLFWTVFIACSRFIGLVPDGFVVYLYSKKEFESIVESSGMHVHWSRGIRIFGIIPYLGVCFSLKNSNSENISG